MKLQSLKYFVSLTKTKSFTKSAEECFITQPALSRSISEMENELGCSLFKRNSRLVELTEEGEICLVEAKKILKQCDVLIEKVNLAKQNFKDPVRIGYIIYGHIAIFNSRLKTLKYSENIKIETEYDTLIKTYNKLVAGDIDIAILPEGFLSYAENIETYKLHDSKLYMLVPSINPLFDKSYVLYDDIKNQKFIGWNEEDIPGINSHHSQSCEENGFKPEFVAYGKKMGDIMTLSIINNAVAFASSNLTIVDLNEFKLVPVADSKENFGLALAWTKGNDNKSRIKLIDLFVKQL